MRTPEGIEPARKPEYTWLWNERSRTWDVGWSEHQRRRVAQRFVDNITFNDVITTYTSESFFCAPYDESNLYIDLSVASDPTTIQIQQQYSLNGVDWFNHAHTPYLSLIYEDSAGAKKEVICGGVHGAYIRYVITAVGTTATKTFTLTIDTEFVG